MYRASISLPIVNGRAVKYGRGSMIAELHVLGMVALSILLGGLIGFERELADKPAGLRTHMLVAASATLLVSLAPTLVMDFNVDPAFRQSDPIRVMEAVVTGVAFLGAGTIIRHKADVEGLTTAASLLFVAAVGIAVAMSHYVLAFGLTILVLIVLRGIKIVQGYLTDQDQPTDDRPVPKEAERADREGV
jgi:putative Mg2+ transporter-C (MgtC) family protein